MIRVKIRLHWCCWPALLPPYHVVSDKIINAIMICSSKGGLILNGWAWAWWVCFVFFLFFFIWPLNVVCCVRSQYVYFVLVVHQYERHNHPPIGLIWGVFFSFSFCTTFFRRTQKTQSAFVHGDFSGRYVLCIFVMRTSKIHGRICIYYYCYTFDSKWWICFVFVSFFRCCLLMLTTSSRISTPTHQNYTYYLSISHRAIVFRAYNI